MCLGTAGCICKEWYNDEQKFQGLLESSPLPSGKIVLALNLRKRLFFYAIFRIQIWCSNQGIPLSRSLKGVLDSYHPSLLIIILSSSESLTIPSRCQHFQNILWAPSLASLILINSTFHVYPGLFWPICKTPVTDTIWINPQRQFAMSQLWGCTMFRSLIRPERAHIFFFI